MPSRSYPLGDGRTLEIRWRFPRRPPYVISIDGSDVTECTRAELLAGFEVGTRDDSTVNVLLVEKRHFTFTEFDVRRDGVALPGSVSDGSWIVRSAAALALLYALSEIQTLVPIDWGATSVTFNEDWFAFAKAIALLLIAEGLRRRLRIAADVAVAYCAIDLLSDSIHIGDGGISFGIEFNLFAGAACVLMIRARSIIRNAKLPDTPSRLEAWAAKPYRLWFGI